MYMYIYCVCGERERLKTHQIAVESKLLRSLLETKSIYSNLYISAKKLKKMKKKLYKISEFVYMYMCVCVKLKKMIENLRKLCIKIKISAAKKIIDLPFDWSQRTQIFNDRFGLNPRS